MSTVVPVAETSGGVTFALIILFILVIVIIIVLVFFAFELYTNRITFGPTGPTGAFGGPPGPTGPTGPRGGLTGTTLQNFEGLNPMMNQMNNGLNGMNNMNMNNMNGMNGMNMNNMNNMNGMNMNNMNGMNGMPVPMCPCPTGSVIASCDQCQFFTASGSISNTQNITTGGKPESVRWVLSSQIPYTDNGTFALPVGTYTLTSTITYVATNNNCGNNPTYRSMAIWIRATDIRGNDSNIVSESDLYNTVTAIAVPNMPTKLTIPLVQFTINDANKNRFSIITWHNASNALDIGSPSQFRLTRV